MSDREPEAEVAGESADPADGAPNGSTESADSDGSTGISVSGRDVRAYVEWGAFAICALFAVIAAFQLYMSVGQLISIWIAEEFQPAFRAAFNLAVLLLASYGAFTLAERLNE